MPIEISTATRYLENRNVRLHATTRRSPALHSTTARRVLRSIMTSNAGKKEKGVKIASYERARAFGSTRATATVQPFGPNLLFPPPVIRVFSDALSMVFTKDAF